MQALAPLLQLAPCPFWRLEAAIAPGPRLPPEEPLPQDGAEAPPASDSVEAKDHPEPSTQVCKHDMLRQHTPGPAWMHATV